MGQVDPVAQGGMLSGLSAVSPASPDSSASSRQPYNGTIKINGETAEVKDGVLNYDGDTAFVSDDGSMVVAPDRTVIGYIENGEFKELTPEYYQQLKIKGVLE